MTPAQITEDNHGRLRLASGNVEFGAAKRLDFYEVEQITPGPFLAGLTLDQARGLMRELDRLRQKYASGATGQAPRSEKREALRARAARSTSRNRPFATHLTSQDDKPAAQKEHAMKRTTLTTQVPTLYRQGDVLIRAVDAIPAKTQPIPREKGRIVLAHGEVTGHSHAIASRAAQFLMATEPSSGGGRFLDVTAKSGVLLQHEEHAEIRLPRGKYQVVIQSEYHPEAIRSVAD